VTAPKYSTFDYTLSARQIGLLFERVVLDIEFVLQMLRNCSALFLNLD